MPFASQLICCNCHKTYQLIANGICKFCGIENLEEGYSFCSISCATSAHQIELATRYLEKRIKKMNHPFDASSNDKTKCRDCGYDYMSHTKAAKCEICGAFDSCDVFDGKLRCDSCIANVRLSLSTAIKMADSVIEKAKEVDASIRFKGDLFNAKTVAIVDIKKAFEEEKAEMNAEEKAMAFQQFLVGRFEANQKIIFDLEEKKHDASVENLAIANVLREYGNSLRNEIREKIRQSDALYHPVSVIPKVKIAKAQKLSPLDRMAQQVAIEKNITIEAAKKLIMAGLGD